jgi:hypothetical protein
MTLVVISPEDLERASSVLDHASGEYRGLIAELRAAAAGLPGPVAGWAGAECARVTAGLHLEAEALGALAATLRRRAREARAADAADGRRGLRAPDHPPNWPRSALPAVNGQPTPEDYLRWLRESVQVGLLAGPAGARLVLSRSDVSGGTTTRNGPGGGAAIVVGLLLLGLLWAKSGGLGGSGNQSQSNNPPDVKSNPECGPGQTPCPTPDPAEVGRQRVQRVADSFGGEAKGVKTNQPITVDQVGSGDIDVEVPSRGIHAEVGGPSKRFDWVRFGKQLKLLIAYTELHGGRAMFFYDQGTDQAVVDFAVKRLGVENVKPIP